MTLCKRVCFSLSFLLLLFTFTAIREVQAQHKHSAVKANIKSTIEHFCTLATQNSHYYLYLVLHSLAAEDSFLKSYDDYSGRGTSEMVVFDFIRQACAKTPIGFNANDIDSVMKNAKVKMYFKEHPIEDEDVEITNYEHEWFAEFLGQDVKTTTYKEVTIWLGKELWKSSITKKEHRQTAIQVAFLLSVFRRLKKNLDNAATFITGKLEELEDILKKGDSKSNMDRLTKLIGSALFLSEKFRNYYEGIKQAIVYSRKEIGPYFQEFLEKLELGVSVEFKVKTKEDWDKLDTDSRHVSQEVEICPQMEPYCEFKYNYASKSARLSSIVDSFSDSFVKLQESKNSIKNFESKEYRYKRKAEFVLAFAMAYLKSQSKPPTAIPIQSTNGEPVHSSTHSCCQNISSTMKQHWKSIACVGTCTLIVLIFLGKFVHDRWFSPTTTTINSNITSWTTTNADTTIPPTISTKTIIWFVIVLMSLAAVCFYMYRKYSSSASDNSTSATDPKNNDRRRLKKKVHKKNKPIVASSSSPALGNSSIVSNESSYAQASGIGSSATGKPSAVVENRTLVAVQIGKKDQKRKRSPKGSPIAPKKSLKRKSPKRKRSIKEGSIGSTVALKKSPKKSPPFSDASSSSVAPIKEKKFKRK